MNELLWLVMLVVNFVFILFAYRKFGKLGLYAWVPISIIIANVQVVKSVDLFGVAATLGNIVYATGFLVTDILSENYGKRDAKRAVYLGFFALISLTVLMQLALYFEPNAFDFAQASLETIFGIMPRILLGSLAAYAASQLHDVWAYNKLKQKFPSKGQLWLRNNGSTMVSQLIDSVLFTFIAFYGVFPMEVLWEILLSTYFLKFVVAAADTPFLYIARKWHQEGLIPED